MINAKCKMTNDEGKAGVWTFGLFGSNSGSCFWRRNRVWVRREVLSRLLTDFGAKLGGEAERVCAAFSRILRENDVGKPGLGRAARRGGGFWEERAGAGRWHGFSLNKNSLSKQLTAAALCGIQNGLFQFELRRGVWQM
jgi:hypothetical protein